MSSESISPAGFYKIREFGYSDFKKVAPNNLEAGLFLYRQYPHFKTENQADEKDYPLVIEIYDAGLESLNQDKDQLHTKESVFFSPDTTKFIFRNETEMHETIISAKRSEETKLIELYQKHSCFCVLDDKIKQFNWSDKYGIKPILANSDKKRDKFKGFFYGYLLGVARKLPKEIYALKREAKGIINKIGATITMPNGSQKTEKINDIESNHKSIIESFKTIGLEYADTNLNNLISFLNKRSETNENEEESYGKNEKNKVNSGKKEEDKGRLLQNKYFDYLDERITRAETLAFNNNRIDPTCLPTISDGAICINDSNSNKILIEIVNELLGDLKANKLDGENEFYEFIEKYAFKIKDIVAQDQEWTDSKEQEYINRLLSHLTERKPFDVKMSQGLKKEYKSTLESFAAFLIKAQKKEIAELEKFMIDSEAYELEIAFGIFGAVFGYAGLPKTFIDPLFDNQSINDEVYRHINREIKKLAPISSQDSNDNMETDSAVGLENNNMEKFKIDIIQEITKRFDLLEREISDIKQKSDPPKTSKGASKDKLENENHKNGTLPFGS
jgi:hypothetical protein